jgi:phosphoribosylaminoimidazole-succinocarboxamide synthase
LFHFLQTLPEAPVELVTELARRYVLLYEMITGREFQVKDLGGDPHASMAAAVKAVLKT